MKSVTVYRVENRNGHGPYRSFYLSDDQELQVSAYLNSTFCFQKNPPPHADGIENHSGDDFCGFHGIRKLRNWFSKEQIKRLQAAGFQFNKYKVPKEYVLVGNCQVMFKKDLAKKVASVNPLPVKA